MSRKDEPSSPSLPPPLPEKWDRCHAYNERKRRYCRQLPIPLSDERGQTNKRARYCGNHRHLMEQSMLNHGHNIRDGGIIGKGLQSEMLLNEDKCIEVGKKYRGKRVPCPIDPSHLVFESAISKHVLVCPAAKEKLEVTGRSYYCNGINLGGFGAMISAVSERRVESDAADVQQLALAVIRVFGHLYLDSKTKLTDQQLRNITESEIYNALPEVDLSSVEEGISDLATCQSTTSKQNGLAPNKTGRLTCAITKHHIKAGGPRHVRQIASILGHVRQQGLLTTNKSEAGSSPPLVCEMGAGRGMTGLVVASAMGASLSGDGSSEKVGLYLIERSGTRGKAETKIRTAAKSGNSAGDCLRLDLVEVKRIKCDLAHVDMSSALPTHAGSKDLKALVIAKHLCGAGTDLAIKSLRNVGSINGLAMATCCHGLCSWDEYVGRDSLIRLFCSETGGLSVFGAKEFNVLKRWTSASVLDENSSTEVATRTDEDEVKEEHSTNYLDDGRRQKIVAVVKESGFVCGARGLGRACQRLIDFGRCDYMTRNMFRSDDNWKVRMLHYVPGDITPQNALILASRCSRQG
ncbi:hypothetical protein ACHAWF_010330 [Thalassiosira exigua]